VASTEQTRAATRDKDAKGSKCRPIALPTLLIDELRRHRATQAEELFRVGVRLNDETRVVTQADGEPLQPNILTQAVTNFMKQPGRQGPAPPPSAQRCQSMLAANGHPKIVQERFGPSSVAITMDIYSHLIPNMQEDAASKVDAALRAAIDKASRAQAAQEQSPMVAKG
jgi:hypothetical protein